MKRLTAQNPKDTLLGLGMEQLPNGGMAEWFKAAVLKTVVPLAAEPWVRILLPPPPPQSYGEMAESAEGARLLSECRT